MLFASKIYGTLSGTSFKTQNGILIGLRSLVHTQDSCTSCHRFNYCADTSIYYGRGDSNLFSIFFNSMNLIESGIHADLAHELPRDVSSMLAIANHRCFARAPKR